MKCMKKMIRVNIIQSIVETLHATSLLCLALD